MPLVSEIIELFWAAYNGRGPKVAVADSKKQTSETMVAV
jgi:hypothetical protein